MARTKKVDFTGVENFTKLPEGINTVKLTEITESNTSEGDDMLKVVFEAVNGKSKGSKAFDNLALSQKGLWKLKQLLVALGMNAEGKVKLDLDKMIGRICDISVRHEEYNGKMMTRIEEYMKTGSAASGDSDDDDEEDDEEDEPEEKKPAKRGPKPGAKAEKKAAEEKKTAKKPPEPEEEDDEDEEEDDDDEADEAPAKSKGKAAEKAKPTTKAKKEAPPAKGKGKKKAEPEPEEDDDDDDWDEDDDDE